jgi:hypothetical protein
MADRLEDLLRASTVRVLGGPMPGAGFFVAPGQVLTCSHVIGDSETLTVSWDQDGQPPVEVPVVGRARRLADWGHAIPALAAGYPDIAVLDVAPLTGHPCVAVDAQRPQQEDQFQAYGYPREGGAIRLTPARLAYRGLHGTAPTVYLDLASDTVKPGMSGAAVLNLRTGRVCGVIVASKHPGQPDGALTVPWSAVSGELADVVAASEAFHRQDRRWQTALGSRAVVTPGRRPASGPTSEEQLTHLLISAEHAARAVTDHGARGVMLAQVARVLAAVDVGQVGRVAADAERAAQTVPDAEARVTALALVARVLAAVDPERARRLAADAEQTTQAVTLPGSRMTALAQVAEALAITDLERAEQIIRGFPEPNWDSKMNYHLALRTVLSPRTAAQRVPEGAASSRLKALGLASVARVVAATEPERARQVAADAERTARASIRLVRDAVLAEVAEALAVSDPERAVRIAWALTQGATRAITLGHVAALVAAADPERARRLSSEAESCARRHVTGKEDRAAALARVAAARAATDPDGAARLTAEAEHVALQMGRLGTGIMKDQILVDAAAAVAGSDPVWAERIVNAITFYEPVVEALCRVATVVAGADPERAERLARSISDPGWRAQALVGVVQTIMDRPDQDAPLTAVILKTFSSL